MGQMLRVWAVSLAQLHPGEGGCALIAFVPPNPNPHRSHGLPAPHMWEGERGIGPLPGSLRPLSAWPRESPKV